jgi:hypothetical protein
MTLRIAWIGLGKIAGHHFEALEHIDDLATPVAGCDPDDAARRQYSDRMPVYISISAMLADHRPDAVVVASPTLTHAQVCEEVLAVADMHAPQFLLVEKPIAASPRDVKRLITSASELSIKMRGLYHAAYAPEVEWALGTFERMATPLRRIESEFLDPYAGENTERREKIYGDSWLDSGINALSIWARFTEILSLTVSAAPNLISTYNAEVAATSAGRAIDGRIFTSWQAIAPAKCTRLYLGEDVQLIMNHQATAAQLFRGTALLDSWATSGEIPRLPSHYLGAFRAALSTGRPLLDDIELLTWLLVGRS